METGTIIKPLITELVERYPILNTVMQDIEAAANLLIRSIEKGGKILVCGNGGSSADADHIVGELMKGFIHSRPLNQTQIDALVTVGGDRGSWIGKHLQQAIPAISLSSPTALITAVLNDTDPNLIFAQQVMGLGKEADVLWGLSTSGNAKNVAAAAVTAKSFGLVTLAMTGKMDSQLSEICDVCIRVDESATYKIQELHLPVYHTLCLIIEKWFFH